MPDRHTDPPPLRPVRALKSILAAQAQHEPERFMDVDRIATWDRHRWARPKETRNA